MIRSALRRDVMLAALASSLPIGLVESAAASPLNPEHTIIRPPSQLQWKSNPAFPEPSVDSCPLTGNVNEPGLYYTLVRWWPGFMSAPHSYTTNRFCVRRNAALRRGCSRASRACHHRHLRHGAGELCAQRSLAAGRATPLSSASAKPLLRHDGQN
jgi:hypothetical protein